jgi:hypothetical protein
LQQWPELVAERGFPDQRGLVVLGDNQGAVCHAGAIDVEPLPVLVAALIQDLDTTVAVGLPGNEVRFDPV